MKLHCRKAITCVTGTVWNFNFFKDSMHVTLRPTIALFLKEFDSYDFWTKKIHVTSPIGWFVLNWWTVMCMTSLQHLFNDILRQHKDSPGDVFKSDKITRGNDAKTESCNQNQCSGPILEKKYSYLFKSVDFQKFQSISNFCFCLFVWVFCFVFQSWSFSFFI